MLIFQRKIEEQILKRLFLGKMIVLLGPRQSGKTTLSKKIINSYGKDGGFFDCQLADTRKHFEVGKPELLLELVKDKKIVVFDEAQTIQNIGSILKAFHDTYPQTQIIATGSSSFDLANKINEPMTGRFFGFTLLPLSIDEIKLAKPNFSREDLDTVMRLGSYPGVVAPDDIKIKEDVLKNIVTNYLYKDIFIFESIRNPAVFENLLKILAMQVGQLVSLEELGDTLKTSRQTIDKYIRLLEQSFIIKRVWSFSMNMRTELKKSFKIFFLDNGVRNVLVDIYSEMNGRQDKGSIFENFFVNEKMKSGILETFPPEIMFWRTRKGLEIDLIEKRGMQINAYECKWKKENMSFKIFLKYYPEAKVQVVTPDSLL